MRQDSEYTSKVLQNSSKLSLTHFMPLISFYTAWKHEETSGFVVFSWSIETSSAWVREYKKEVCGIKWVKDTDVIAFILVNFTCILVRFISTL